jgi:hypothetical protein
MSKNFPDNPHNLKYPFFFDEANCLNCNILINMLVTCSDMTHVFFLS